MNKYNAADIKFLQAMIVHHEAALKMATDVYSSGSCPDVKAFALKIYNAQKKEIEQMKGWLKERGVSVGGSMSGMKMR